MALSLVEVLFGHGHVDQDALAAAFAARFAAEPRRGYGGGARKLLTDITAGGDFRQLAPELFPGGSYGNGAAMRVAPLGAFFAGEGAERCVEQARLSARVTHTHPEAVDGAVVVALAAATPVDGEGARWLEELCAKVEAPKLRAGLVHAAEVPASEAHEAAESLGTGYAISAYDTVPFCMWMVAHHGDDFAQAMWLTAEGGGDVDTTCAIVAGVLAAHGTMPPPTWLERREPLPRDFVST
jgi:ADP-ribosylglycohydrolase